MSTLAKSLIALCLVAFTAACAQQEEVVVVPTPVVADPVSQKY